jgi:hypothetical protein
VQRNRLSQISEDENGIQQDVNFKESQEEEKSSERTMRYDPDWQSRGCRKHGPTE